MLDIEICLLLTKCPFLGRIAVPFDTTEHEPRFYRDQRPGDCSVCRGAVGSPIREPREFGVLSDACRVRASALSLLEITKHISCQHESAGIGYKQTTAITDG